VGKEENEHIRVSATTGTTNLAQKAQRDNTRARIDGQLHLANLLVNVLHELGVQLAVSLVEKLLVKKKKKETWMIKSTSLCLYICSV
jgi:hypothetical protein